MGRVPKIQPQQTTDIITEKTEKAGEIDNTNTQLLLLRESQQEWRGGK